MPSAPQTRSSPSLPCFSSRVGLSMTRPRRVAWSRTNIHRLARIALIAKSRREKISAISAPRIDFGFSASSLQLGSIALHSTADDITWQVGPSEAIPHLLHDVLFTGTRFSFMSQRDVPHGVLKCLFGNLFTAGRLDRLGRRTTDANGGELVTIAQGEPRQLPIGDQPREFRGAGGGAGRFPPRPLLPS